TSVAYSPDNTTFVYGRGDATTVLALTGFNRSHPVALASTPGDAPATPAATDAPMKEASTPANDAKIAAVTPSPVGVIPAAGNLASQSFAFSFTNPGGAANLGVLNVLMSTALDGRHACYLAYVPAGLTSGTLLLVNDNGDAGGPYQVLS